jgi:3'(2'), 5'-bisphosphate nucleotidase
LTNLASLAEALVPALQAASAFVLQVRRDGVKAMHKDDRSLVTLADHGAEEILIAAVNALTPDIPIIAEEQVAAGGAPASAPARFWLIDPVDGTHGYVHGEDEFTVNLGLVSDGVPVLGLIQHPVSGVLWVGHGDTAWKLAGSRTPIHVRPRPEAPLILTSAKNLNPRTKAFVDAMPQATTRQISSSIKFCWLADGRADLYPRFGETSEWDTAAGQAILAAAGGHTRTPEGAPFRYGKPGFKNGPFIASGG